MTGVFDLQSHLIFYRSYHFNQVNVSIHLLCIPIIILSAIAIFTKYSLFHHEFLNLGSILAWSYGIYYVLLDWQVGIPSALILTVGSYIMSWFFYTSSASAQHSFNSYAIGLHVVAWLAQFYGHGVHERRSPALLDNLLQALVLAPFFVGFEVAFALGYKLDVKKKMDNEAGKRVRDFRLKRQQDSGSSK